MNRFLTTAVAAATLAVGISAQEARPAARIVPGKPSDRPPSEELVARRDAKLAGEWIGMAPWKTDFDEARAAARSSGKPILAYFSRSYAA